MYFPVFKGEIGNQVFEECSVFIQGDANATVWLQKVAATLWSPVWPRTVTESSRYLLDKYLKQLLALLALLRIYQESGSKYARLLSVFPKMPWQEQT